jgi:putative membrane protein
MQRFLLRWFIDAVALLVVIHISSSVASADYASLIVMALVLGLLNSFLKPLLSFLSLPIMILTLGLFTLIINATTFYIAAKLVEGFYVASFGSAVWAAFLYSVITFFINLIIKSEKESYQYTLFYRRRF